MNYQFYKVTGGKLAAKMNELRDAKVAFNKHMQEVCKTVGATEARVYTSGGFACFQFDKRPAKEVWKVAETGYLPKRSTTEGRKIQDLINKVRPAEQYVSGLSLFKLDGRMLLGAGTRQGVPMHRAGIVGRFADGVFFIKVPVSDSEPYEPTDSDMVKCEEWEMMKFMSEGKES